MVKSKNKSFTVQFKIVTVVDQEIRAESFEGALELAKIYKDTDIIDYRDNGVNDSRITIIGMFGGEDWDT